MEEYEGQKVVAKTENITLGELLDVWAEEELKVSSLSNNTVTGPMSIPWTQKVDFFMQPE